jgi:hypothetical protein
MTYADFWLIYLRAHARPVTRMLHYVGTSIAITCLVTGAFVSAWLLLAAPMVGYGFAWSAHYGLEGNRPKTFGHPIWSLASDVRMLALAVTGRLQPHLVRARVS